MDSTTQHLLAPVTQPPGLDSGLAAALAAAAERLGRRAHAAWVYRAPEPSMIGRWEDLTDVQREACTAAGVAAAAAVIAEIAPFWVSVTDDGDLGLSGPCVETIGCLFGRELDGVKTTLGQLIEVALGHTGPQAGQQHQDFLAYVSQCEAAGQDTGGQAPAGSAAPARPA
jgi:hypothetical protein